MPLRPPELITAGPIVLRRHQPADADPIAVAVSQSLEHLRPWMPWATPANATARAQLERLLSAQEGWESGSECGMVMTLPEGAIVGACGLHRRVGEGGIEIGYWVHVDHVRKGYATAAARALTDAALALSDVARVEIHCDEANVASAAVPRRLGYRLDRIETDRVEAPGEVGRSMIWIMEASRSR